MKKALSYSRTVAHHSYGCFIFKQILLVSVFGVKMTHTKDAPTWTEACLGGFSPFLRQQSQMGSISAKKNANYRFISREIL